MSAFGKGWLAWAVCGLLICGAAEQVGAQNRTFPASLSREQRDQNLGDLDRTFDDFGARPRPGTNRSANIDPGRPSPEMERLRPLIAEIQTELQQLTADLTDQAAQDRAFRQPLVDGMNLLSKTTMVAKRSKQLSDHRDLLQDFQDLDGLWRDFSYRMSLMRNIDRQTKGRLATIDDLGKQIAKELSIQPQVNKSELLQRTVQLQTDIQNLVEDAQLELGRDKDSQATLLALGKVQQQAKNLSVTLQDPAVDRNSLVEEYQRFQQLWYPQAAKLQTVENRYLERGLRRITQSDGEIHQLLLLPQRVEKDQLLYLANTLKKDIDEFFDRTPLKLLTHLPKANMVLSTADEFYGVCENFADVVQRGGQQNDVIDAFRQIELTQKNFSAIFRSIDSDAALAVLRKIDQTINTLRTSLQVQREDFSRQSAVDLVAAIDNLGDQMASVTKQWLQNERPANASDCMREVNNFADLANQLHQDLLRGGTAADARKTTEDLYDSWRKCYNYLVKCQSDERPQLGRMASKITPSLVELRTMLAQ